MIRVAVAGALGRMGRVACAAIAGADDLQLAGGVARSHAGEPLAPAVGLTGDGGAVFASVEELCARAKPDVLVDFTLHPASVAVARSAVEAGVATVVGTSGWTTDERAALADLCARTGTSACIAPNMALGAVLMMQFAERAAPHFPTVEIVELHHDQKRDAPSGTARLTAERIAAATARADVPIHSVRLRGLVAHQEVLFGGTGEVLTIRHDSLSRESFAAGILLAIRNVRSNAGLMLGLDAYLDTPAGAAAAR
jgi:4-hydroxy-tetrahydrodipicolinate reductase